MLKFLIVSSKSEQLKAMQGRFIGRFGDTAEIKVAKSALYALTDCDVEKPRLIISGDEAGELTGLDFFEIIREDPDFDDVLFILLDSSAMGHARLSAKDRALPFDSGSLEVMRSTFDLLTEHGFFSDERSTDRDAGQASDAASDANVKAKGTLEVLTLFDLMISLNQSSQTGTLNVEFDDDSALIDIQNGAIQHAHYGNLSGENALIKIFKEANAKPQTFFYFEDKKEGLESNEKTIHLSINELLLKVAVALDHAREETNSGKLEGTVH